MTPLALAQYGYQRSDNTHPQLDNNSFTASTTPQALGVLQESGTPDDSAFLTLEKSSPPHRSPTSRT